jgi:limonene-1,2-epoxide hydrolase
VRPWAVAALVVVSAASLGGCGSGAPSAESVVRAWSQALNDEDNDRAADLFARGAEIVQAGQVLTLDTHKQAVAWNAALPCSGRIVSLTSHADTIRATFLLGNREHSKCDGPGDRATAVFEVVKGKITLWHQTGPNGPPAPQV